MPGSRFASLPKPVRFGLFGAAGGLIGALLVGELVWRLLEPPPPPPPAAPPPRLAVSASPAVGLFQGGKNTFTVQFDSDRLDSVPVAVRFSGVPVGVTIPTIDGTGKGDREVAVTASAGAAVGTHSVTVTATAVAAGRTVTAETTVSVLINPLPVPVVDIMFVLDVTASMTPFIVGVRDGIADFVSVLAKQRINSRIAMLAFRDRTAGDEPELLLFDGDPFTVDVSAFRGKVGQLQAWSSPANQDPPESVSDALVLAAAQPFRPKATKILLLITDAPPKEPDKDTARLQDAVDVLAVRGVDQVHLVVRKEDLATFAALQRRYPGGKFFDLTAVTRGRTSFARLLPELSKVIATAAAAARPDQTQLPAAPPPPVLVAAQGLQSSRQFDPRAAFQLFVAISFWTAAVGAGVSLALATGQFLSLGRRPTPAAALLGVGGGLAAGLVGGAAGQGLFAVAPDNATVVAVFRVVAWAVFGGLAGAGLAFVVPNLRKSHGLVGGVLGGGLGAVGYLAAAGVGLGDTPGRVAGAVILGFCIGLMVALVEAVLRRAWLEVKFGGGETITVNLGPEPLKIGADSKQCAVWARGAAPVALRYWVRGGKVICDDAGTEREAGEGDTRRAGAVEVTVRTAGGGNDAPRPAAVVTQPAAPPTRSAKPPGAKSVEDVEILEPVGHSTRPPPVPAAPKLRCDECGGVVAKKPGVCGNCGAMT